MFLTVYFMRLHNVIKECYGNFSLAVSTGLNSKLKGARLSAFHAGDKIH